MKHFMRNVSNRENIRLASAMKGLYDRSMQICQTVFGGPTRQIADLEDKQSTNNKLESGVIKM